MNDKDAQKGPKISELPADAGRGDGPADDGPGEDLSGRRIDAWRIEHRLARGGLATVYLAHRADGAYEQRAAFKVLRRGLDTDDLVARFRAERQILSSLEHPAIAQILDGGALADGRPYLVLEFVDGVPITEYCLAHRVPLRARLRLLLDVLAALHHAHKHLVVHRDVKPSNILVSQEGHVSLLDFGIAKLLDPGSLPGATTLTRTGISLRTPGYSSPEQHAGEPVTTASDIYQAGAVLFEMLTGRRARGVADGENAFEPALPSDALKGSPERHAVQGDLDAIVRKAMHADPSQRYASADEMAADLKRYLDGRPILARPDTLRYRLAKFSRRRPWALPAAAIAVLAVGGYVVTLNVYTEQLRIEQRRASAAQAFMVDLLRSPEPFHPADPERGRHITVVEALDLGVARLETELHDDPELRASLLSSIADVYASLDQHDDAIALREEALPLERETFGEASHEVLRTLTMLAEQYLAAGDYDRAGVYYEELLELALATHPEDHPTVGAALASMAQMKGALGEDDEARRLYEQSIGILSQAPREYSKQLINALVALGYYQRVDEEYEAAIATLSEALALAVETFGADSLSAALVHAETATFFSRSGEYEKAEREFGKSIAIYDQRLGRDHGATLSALNNLGVMYLGTGQYDEAEETMREVLQRYEQKYGSGHRIVATTYQNLATAISRRREYEESIPLHRKAFEIYESVADEDLSMHAFPLLSIAYGELELGEHASAEVTARKALGMLEKTAAGTFLVGVAQCFVALAMEGQGRTGEGHGMLTESHRTLVGSSVGEPYRSACRVPEVRSAAGAVLPSIADDLVCHYDFDHPLEGNPDKETDLGRSGTVLQLVNGGASMRVEDAAYPRAGRSLQTRQVNPAVSGNDDWKAGVYEADGVASLHAFNAAAGITLMGWVKPTDMHPKADSTTAEPDDAYGAVGLFGLLSGNSDGHLVRALLEVIDVSGTLRLVALGRREDDGESLILAADADWESLLPTGTWTHLAASFDFDAGTMALYRNGDALPAAYTAAGDRWRVSGDPEPDATSASDPAGIKIGGSFPQNTRERNAFDGRFDDLMFFDRVLTADEVRAQFARFAAISEAPPAR